MAAAGEPPGISPLARRARVSRRFIYDHPELRAEIARQAAQVADQHAGTVAASTAVTAALLRADLENAKAAIAGSKLTSPPCAGASARSSAATSSPRSAAPKTRTLPPASASSSKPSSDAQEALAQRTKELEAARQINRELMARLNRDS